MVFQSYALYPNMTVAGNISFGMEMRGVPVDERKKAIDKVAKVLQIGHLLDRKPSQLSGGQRQRVAMGRALVRDPKLFLFDEPLSNLDAKLRVDMRIEIKRLHQATGTSIVYVTHDQIEAMTLATKIAVMRDGEVQQFGTPAEIYNNPKNLFVADFMGSPAMNLLTATIGTGGNDLHVRRAAARRPQPIAPAGAADGRACRLFQGKQMIFGIRPEALTDPDGADRNAISLFEGDCLIEVVEPAGSDTFAVTKLGGKEVVARLRADARIAPARQHAGLPSTWTRRCSSIRKASSASAEPCHDETARYRHHRLRHWRSDDRFRSCRHPAHIAILERGERLADTPEHAHYRSIFVDGHFRPKEMWREPDGTAFNPGNFYFVGGNSKLFGAVLLRYRAEDFTEMQHLGGVSPAWPFPYEELEPWYGKAERLFEVRGELGQDPTEPFHSTPYSHGPCRTSPPSPAPAPS
jgi:multiple sugar transport system ATP-binding protein